MSNALILGGTGWLSGRIAQRLLDEGWSVTCLARGGRAAPDGAELVTGDRDDRDAYASVAARDWDHVIDVSSRADHVVAAVEAVGDRARRWTYVSSMSVYADDVTEGADESAPLHPPAERATSTTTRGRRSRPRGRSAQSAIARSSCDPD